MGYRSDVIFWVHKSLVSRLLTMTNQDKEAFNVLFKWADLEKDKEGNMKFDIGHIKWYDAYKGVGTIEGFMCDLEAEDLENEFGFHRLGEEFGDHEQRGCSDLWEVYPMQSLSCN